MFVTYSLSFMMMLVVIGGLLVAIGLPGLASLLFFVPPFHMYRRLGAELSRFSAIMRTMALMHLHRRRPVPRRERRHRRKLA